MKITLSLLSIILFVGIGLGQKSKSAAELKQQISTLKNKKNFSLDHNAVDNRTSVAFTSMPDTINNSNFYASSTPSRPERFGRRDFFAIGSGFEFEGQALTKTADDFFIFITYIGYPFLASSNPKLIALIDGQSTEIGEDRQKIQRNIDQRYNPIDETTEHFKFTVNRENLRLVAAAKSVKLRIGNFERKLSSEQIKMLGDILNLSEVPN